jgi:branched-chain amino acid transport system permease protein
MEYTSQIIQYLISGLTSGSVYAVIALGFTVIHNATGIMNIAQGDFAVWGGLSLATFLISLGLPLPLAFILAIVGVFIVGLLVEKVIMRQIRSKDLMMLIVVTIAISATLQGSARMIWGPDTRSVPSFSGETPIELFGAFIPLQVLWILLIVGITSFLLWYFFEKTIFGKAMRACSEDKIAATSLGVNPDRMILLSWGISGMLGAIGGAVIMPITLMVYDAGLGFAIKGFAGAVLGGLGSYRGAVVGSILIGLLESVAAGFISPTNKDIFAMAVIIIVFLLKPSGIFGIRRRMN